MRARTGARRRFEPMYLIIEGSRRSRGSRRTTLRWAVMMPGDLPETPGAGADSHWVRWHAPYEDPSSGLSQRLRAVQSMLGAALDEIAPRDPASATDTHPEPIRIVSLCAGQGRDVIDVVATHPRGPEVS